MESGSLSPTEMAELMVVAKDLVVETELLRRVLNLRERLGARERVKESGAVNAEVGERNGLATEEEEERSLETEIEVAMDDSVERFK